MTTNIPAPVLERFKASWSKAAPEYREKALEFLVATYQRFMGERLADSQFTSRLLKGSENEYQQRLGELLFAAYLWRHGFTLASSNEGPDFKATKDGHSIWMEVHTPEIDEAYRTIVYGEVRTVPHAERTLRWTSALKEKAEKLLGNAEKGKLGYLKNGIVGSNEPYVIVINSTLLDPFHIGLTGVSQFPYPVEICFGVGPLAATLDRMSGEVVWSGNTQRLQIERTDKSPVPSDSFLSPSYAAVSAVIGIDLDANFIVGEEPHAAAVYNPHAINPIPHGLLPSSDHWVCDYSEDGYTVSML